MRQNKQHIFILIILQKLKFYNHLFLSIHFINIKMNLRGLPCLIHILKKKKKNIIN